MCVIIIIIIIINGLFNQAARKLKMLHVNNKYLAYKMGGRLWGKTFLWEVGMGQEEHSVVGPREGSRISLLISRSKVRSDDSRYRRAPGVTRVPGLVRWC